MVRTKQDDVLSRLVREVRSDEVPAVDWDKVERSLTERVARAPALAPVKARRSAWGPLALAAAAAAVLGVFGARELAHQEPLHSMERSATRWSVEAPITLDGSRLAVGQRVTAGAAEVRVVHAGKATWTLAPGSRGMVTFGGELLTVQIEHGAALAEVVPAKRIESFAIEADALRAAAHGTVFRVTRRGDRVYVDVSEGVVAVGPASTRGATRGWLLTAPARGHFSLDGKSGSVEGETASVATTGGPLAAKGTGAGVNAGAVSQSAELTGAESDDAAAELPDKPTMDAVQAGFAKLIPAVNQCFQQNTQARGDIEVTANTRVTVKVAPDGSIASREFAPPLAPAVLSCSAPKIDAIRFAPSKQGITVSRYMQLAR
jgi:ferric-dicitrate binding protein FerR (iron transport regulator)